MIRLGPTARGGYFTMGKTGDVRQFWVVFGLKNLGLGYTFTVECL